MENVEVILRDLFIALTNAKNIIDEDPSVKCSRKLQGAIVKLNELAEELQKNGKLPSNTFVAHKSDE